MGALKSECIQSTRRASRGRHSPSLPTTSAVTVPLTKSGVADRSTRDAIESEFARVAEFHHLTRVARAGAPGLERFDYFANGRRTQSIHIITPLAMVRATSPPASPLLPPGKGKAAPSSLSSSLPPQISGGPRHPRLAIVIDDLGNDRAQADALFKLSYPLTLSVLPYHSGSTEIAEEAHRRGYEVMLHLPMASNVRETRTNRSSFIRGWMLSRWRKHFRPCWRRCHTPWA